MRVGGSTVNAAELSSAASPGRSAAGDGHAEVNRRIVRRLRETDEELRAKLRREAVSASGVPHFVDVRGPDLGLYTIDGMVVGGMLTSGTGQGVVESTPTKPVTPIADESPRQPVTSNVGGKTRVATKSEGGLPATGVPTRGAAAYTAAAVGVGASKDMKA